MVEICSACNCELPHKYKRYKFKDGHYLCLECDEVVRKRLKKGPLTSLFKLPLEDIYNAIPERIVKGSKFYNLANKKIIYKKEVQALVKMIQTFEISKQYFVFEENKLSLTENFDECKTCLTNLRSEIFIGSTTFPIKQYQKSKTSTVNINLKTITAKVDEDENWKLVLDGNMNFTNRHIYHCSEEKIVTIDLANVIAINKTENGIILHNKNGLTTLFVLGQGLFSQIIEEFIKMILKNLPETL